MNILFESVDALRNLWGYLKCILYKYNVKYLVLPIIYLFVILLIIPSATLIINEVSYKTLDSYTKALTNEEKKEIILDKFNLTEYEFNVLSAIVLSEAEFNSYDDAYAVINTIYNRTKSSKWIRWVKNGESLYNQAIAPNQFVVYQHGSYKKNLGNTESPGYDAIIDFLFTEDVMHDYLSFRSHNTKVKNYETFSPKGNKYFNKLV